MTWLNDFFEGRAKAKAANHRQGRQMILDIIAATGLPGAVVANWLDQLEKDGRIERRPTGKVGLNFTNNIPKVIAEMERRAKAASLATAEAIATKAKANAPVDTGRLRSSIRAQATETGAEVVVGAKYGGFVELGTKDQRPQPYLTPAVESERQPFEERGSKVFG